jgi:hypothetical protein
MRSTSFRIAPGPTPKRFWNTNRKQPGKRISPMNCLRGIVRGHEWQGSADPGDPSLWMLGEVLAVSR